MPRRTGGIFLKMRRTAPLLLTQYLRKFGWSREIEEFVHSIPPLYCSFSSAAQEDAPPKNASSLARFGFGYCLDAAVGAGG